MKAAAVGIVVLSLSLGVCAATWADGLPWEKPPEKAGQPKTPDGAMPIGEANAPPVADKPGLDLEKELPPSLYARTVKPITLQVEVAKKQEALADKEMEKPEKLRLEKRALGFKDNAAKAYLGASLKAKQAVNLVKEPAHKDAIVAQYENPCRQSAVKLYLSIAEACFKGRDVRMAVAYYRKVLAVDPENQTAKEELEKIRKAVAQAIEDRKKGPRSSGGDDDTRDLIGLEKDFGKTGRDDIERDHLTGRDRTDWRKVGGSGIP
jgi:tetratricopeptide (TPR) repeat protein